VRDGHESGLPIMRARGLHAPDDPAAVAHGDGYLWGGDILVAPVVERGATSGRLYLPRGAWYDFWTDERVEGGREIDRPVDLATMPLYVRAGAVLPLGPVKQYAEQPTDEPLTLVVHPGASGSSTLYEDDGLSFDHRTGEWMRVAMAWDDATRRLSLSLAGGRMLPPSSRSIRVRVAGSTATTHVTQGAVDRDPVVAVL
jgi:alpha-glucosidase/alpha-D-xyloside xylohydrolase